MAPNQQRGILFDLDGVLYNANQVIPGAVEAIRWVQAKKVPHLFVTNTTSRSRAALASKLAAFGFEIPEGSILTPAAAAAQWLRRRPAENLALFVQPSTRAEFAEMSWLDETADRGASYVIVGDLGEGWDYRTLNRAFRQLHYNPKAVLMALGMTRYWRTEDGISLDVAPFVVALEHASGRKAEVFGKPAARFFEAAAKRLDLPPDRIVMIGDDIATDIGGAQLAGMQGLLVRSGKFQASDLESDIKPDFVMDSIAGLENLWSSSIAVTDS
jgi:phospholysine phosphohistidine inorganic pyrophosphate phosphatase